MRLQGLSDGRLIGTSGRAVYAEGDDGQFRPAGRLPIPESGPRAIPPLLKTARPWKPAVGRVVGRFPTVNVWPTADGPLVGSALRWLFAATGDGRRWRATRRLPDSSGPMGVLPSAFCEHDGEYYVGEYPLDGDAVPRVLRSADGETWEPLASLPGVRHVHAIASDPYSGELWVTTGDADDECRIGRLRDGRFEAVGSGGQRWRAVEPVFTPAGVLWGVDSVYAESNPVFLLRRAEFGRDDPQPERVATAEGSVYYGVTFAVDGERWVAFSTAVEPGPDSTAPAGSDAVRTGRATVLAASSASGYERWYRVAAYAKRPVVGDRGPLDSLLPSANAYLFLAADDERGLFVNPFNTARRDGTIRNYRPAFFDRLPRSRPVVGEEGDRLSGRRSG